MRLGRSGECNVRSGRPSLRTHFRILPVQKNDFSEIEKSMNQRVAWQKLGILYSPVKCSKWSADPSYAFSNSGCPCIRHWLGREGDDSKGCLVLTRQFILSVLFKIPLWRSRESNVVSGRRSRKHCCIWKPGTSHTFWPSGYPNVRISRGREIDDLKVCLLLSRRFIIFGLSKYRHGRGRESNVASFRWDLRTHFRLLAIPRYDFSEVEKGVAYHYVGILYILAFQNPTWASWRKQFSKWSAKHS